MRFARAGAAPGGYIFSMRRLVLAVLLLSFAAALAVARAQPRDNICAALDAAPADVKARYEGWPREEACEAYYWSTFKARSASELLDPQGYKAYAQALQQRQCDRPLAMIAVAFVAAYSQAPNILTSGQHFSSWKVRVLDTHYPELGLCLRLRDIEQAQGEIEARGLAAERYRSSRESLLADSLPDPVRKRNTAIYALLNLKHYVPALLALAHLSHEGKVIRFVPDYQYYLLRYLAQREVGRDQLAVMLAAAEANLQPARREALDAQARAGAYEGPQPVTQ